ncbi:MAG: PEP-CTERM sorting domain-containing protein [Armatimonadota bacterium]
MKILKIGSMVAVMVLGGMLSASATVLLSDDFTSFVTAPGGSYRWAGYGGTFPTVHAPVTVDGRSALNLSYTAGSYKGIALIGSPLPAGDGLTISTTFKPVADTTCPIFFRVAAFDANVGAFTVFFDTFFWGPASGNQNLVDVVDNVSGNVVWGPLNAWHCGGESDNWYNYTINMGATSSTATLSDINGNALWTTGVMPGIGTAGLKAVGNYEFAIFSIRDAPGTTSDYYLDSFVVTDVVPEPGSVAVLALGLVGMAGSMIKRNNKG